MAYCLNKAQNFNSFPTCIWLMIKMIVIIDHLSRMTVQYQVLLSMGSCNDVCNDLNDTLLSV